MRFLLNIIWLILGGLITALAYALLGLILCITIVGIPFGKQCFKMASLYLGPFGKDVKSDFGKHPIANIIWMIFVGWEMAIGHLVAGVLCCITIIGIPLGLQWFKFAQLTFMPFGAQIK